MASSLIKSPSCCLSRSVEAASSGGGGVTLSTWKTMRPSVDARGRRAVTLLRQGEGLRHGGRQDVHGDAVALQGIAGQHFDIEVLGDVLERLAAVQAGDQVLRIFGDLGPHLIGAPIFGDLVLDLIERLELLGHHAQHFVPDDALVLGIDRIVLDPGIGGEDGVQQILLRRQRDASSRLACGPRDRSGR